MCKKIGILGGTFDPFHKGHFMLAETAYRQFLLDEIWIMPNGNPPHKKDTKQTDFRIRCKMINLAIADIDYMKLCEIEGSDHCYHYTYQTLEYFKETYPEDQFYFIIGADSLNDFPKWKEPGKITGLCTLLVASRDESGIEELTCKIAETKAMFGGSYLILNSPKIDAASSEIRQMISSGNDVSSYLNSEVADYILKEQLYQQA